MCNKSYLPLDAGGACVIPPRLDLSPPNQTRPTPPLFAKYAATVLAVTVT